ncbi:MAG: HEAT repeat domain-containing protein [Desulfatibacillum sp.]|nr:HEAT repeat domain-containing protein [Desulfatibacillum sp.]
MKKINCFISTCCVLIALLAFAGCASIRDGGAKTAMENEEAQTLTAETAVLDSTPDTRALDPAVEKKQKSLKGIRSMAKMGDKAVNHLTELTLMRDEDIRLTAVETLGMIQSPCALDPLISALADDDYLVRQAAVTALIYRGPLMTRVHVDRLLFIVRNATKCWPDPAMEGGSICATHYAGKVLSKAQSSNITPEMAREGYEAVVQY